MSMKKRISLLLAVVLILVPCFSLTASADAVAVDANTTSVTCYQCAVCGELSVGTKYTTGSLLGYHYVTNVCTSDLSHESVGLKYAHKAGQPGDLFCPLCVTFESGKSCTVTVAKRQLSNTYRPTSFKNPLVGNGGLKAAFYTSSNTSVAVVGLFTGIITASKPGTTTITVTAYRNAVAYQFSYALTVKAA